MDQRIVDLKRRAREISSGRPQTAFSLDCAEELAHASTLFFEHPMMHRLQGDALGFLNEPYGVGVEHGKRVAIDAAALVLAEPTGLDQEERRRLSLLAAMAGLLHDAMRHEEDHAELGADLVLRLLRGYPISSEERIHIAQAVALHETILPLAEGGPESARLLAAAVFDADRFRFGPDFFAATLWELFGNEEWDLKDIAAALPKGRERAKAALADGFRTELGRRYGPALLAEGLALADLYAPLFEQALADTPPSNT
jgi:hypothetical protein